MPLQPQWQALFVVCLLFNRRMEMEDLMSKELNIRNIVLLTLTALGFGFGALQLLTPRTLSAQTKVPAVNECCLCGSFCFTGSCSGRSCAIGGTCLCE